MKIKIKKLHPDAVVPRYATEYAAGFDLYSIQTIIVHPGERVSVPTGIAVELPHDHVFLIWDKSGLSHKHGLKTLGGVVDADYRGEILVGITNLGHVDYVLEKGHKIAQAIIQKIEHPEIEVVDELSETLRGAGGFGSTGK
jgi:dUTP pyrophosphatase